MTKKLISIFLALFIALQTVALPVTAFADDDDNEIVNPNAAQPEILFSSPAKPTVKGVLSISVNVGCITIAFAP